MPAPIRYMGTKRALAPLVREELLASVRGGRIADLFAGMGAVPEELASARPLLINDNLRFATCVARARFTDSPHVGARTATSLLFEPYVYAVTNLRNRFRDRLKLETEATADRARLSTWIRDAPHAGSSTDWRDAAISSARASGATHYSLVTLYFSASYFSTAQAIELDAIRYAIDLQPPELRDWLLAAWLATAGRLINAPGHTAQFLRPTSDASFARLVLRWNQPVWTTFQNRLAAVAQVGTRTWRTSNRVTTLDAVAAIKSEAFDGVRVAYVDPPYTKDHYSRFYHVLETLYLYDYPGSTGIGRYRNDRLSSDFSVGTRVVAAFRLLFEAARQRECHLVVSYPEDGLLSSQGWDLQELARENFDIHRVIEIRREHSTFGASDGSVKVDATERLYVCRYRRRAAEAA